MIGPRRRRPRRAHLHEPGSRYRRRRRGTKLRHAIACRARRARHALERSPELGGNASWLAGGMLAPFCEGKARRKAVARAFTGRDRLVGTPRAPWRDARRQCWPSALAFAISGRDRPLLRRGRRRMRQWTKRALRESEPDLAGRFRKGLFFVHEGHLDPRVALAALTERRRGRKAARSGLGWMGEAPGDARVLLDCRGWGIRKALPELRAGPRRNDAHPLARGDADLAQCAFCIPASPALYRAACEPRIRRSA